jgi:hypothetical protein
MEQLGSHWTDLHEILYLITFRKCVAKIQILLNPDKNYVQFTFWLMDVYDISFNSFLMGSV